MNVNPGDYAEVVGRKIGDVLPENLGLRVLVLSAWHEPCNRHQVLAHGGVILGVLLDYQNWKCDLLGQTGRCFAGLCNDWIIFADAVLRRIPEDELPQGAVREEEREYVMETTRQQCTTCSSSG